ncbi:MAG: thiamine diphosphokinase [Bacillota bacterium]
MGDGPWCVVAADSGASLASLLGLRPDVVVGDMDSLDDADRQALLDSGCRFEVHPVEKDETDAHLGMEWAHRAGFGEIVVVCHASGRLDHMLGAIWAACRYVEAGAAIYFVDEGFEAALVHGPARVDITASAGLTVSVIPVSGRAEGITETGMKYPLKRESLGLGESRGISNLTTGPRARVTVESGFLLVMAMQIDAG